MAVTLTPTAAKHVAANLNKRGKGVGLRLGVRTTGCSGLAYKLEYADEAKPEDVTFVSHGVTVVVDPKSLPYIDGTELDFAKRRPERGLQVPEPQREGRVRLRRELQRLTPCGRRARPRAASRPSARPTAPSCRRRAGQSSGPRD